MDEILTMAEIESKYPSEWVLVENPEVNEHLEVLRGKVLWHSKDRDEVYKKMIEVRPKSPATLYTGNISQDSVIIL